MTYYGAKDMAAAFRTVRANTLVIANDLTEEQYGFSPAAGTRTAGQLLLHIAMAPEMAEQIHKIDHVSTLEGFNFMGIMGRFMEAEKKPHSKAEIIALLQESGERFAGWLETVSDDFLAERVTMPAGASPASKTRFEMIQGLKEHEMHHRAQLMLIQRLTGGVPHLTRQMMERMAGAQQKA